VGIIVFLLGISNVFLASKRTITNQKCTESGSNLHTKREVELAIGIVTVARQNNEEYLLQTLHGIQREANDFGAELLKSVIVLHPRSVDTPHTIFDKARAKFSNDDRFEFFSHDAKDATLTETDGLIRKMRVSDRQQNLDAAQLFDTVHTRFCSNKPNGYLLLMEDDFDLCPNSFVHYQRILFAAENLFFPNFTAVRTSYGFSGLLFHCHDLPFNRDMFRTENAILPPDTLVGYSFSRRISSATNYYKNRQYAVYRHNLMNHIGQASTLDSLQYERVFPGCFDSLHYRGILEDCHLCFDEHEMCELKEFSPCTHPDMRGSILSVRASAEHDPQFMMNDPSVDEIKILTGEYGQDCNQVCNARNMQCAKYMLPLVNKCSVLKRKLKCDVCIDHNLRFDSSHRNPGYNNVDKACYVSKILEKLKCEGGTHSFKRICPCANHFDNEDEKEFSPQVLKEIMPGIPNLDQDFKLIQETIVLANLTTCERKAAFLAQVAIETADLNHFNQEHHIEMFCILLDRVWYEQDS
jgi:hypothetical protein